MYIFIIMDSFQEKLELKNIFTFFFMNYFVVIFEVMGIENCGFIVGKFDG